MRNERERPGEDEIDVFELCESLWRQKLLIFVVAVIVFAGAVLYAFWASPVYQAKLFLRPPLQADLAVLNQGRGGDSNLAMVSVKDGFDAFVRNLESEAMRRKFFETIYLPALTEQQRRASRSDLYTRFLASVSVGALSGENPGDVSIRMEAPDPVRSGEWVSLYAAFAGELGRDEIVQNIITDARTKANNIEQAIMLAREGARGQREDRIVKLTESLGVARSMGLEVPPMIISGQGSDGDRGSLDYLRGIKALEAEIKSLRERESDDPFVADLRKQQELLAFYRSLKIDPEQVRIYRQDGAVEVSEDPVRPNRKLVVAGGLLLGLVLGGGLALMRHFWMRRRAGDAG